MSPDLTLWSALVRAPFFEQAGARLAAENGEPVEIDGLVEPARAQILSLLTAAHRLRSVVVVHDDTALQHWQRDLAALARLSGLDPRAVVVLPALDADPYDDIPPHPEVMRERIVALERLRAGNVRILLTPVRGLLQPLPRSDDWSAWTRTVAVGAELPPDRFVLEAMGVGYRRVEIVSAPGEVSRRGGIVDVFPPTAAEPVRIELFGDTVDSLRSFDTDHQRSTGQLSEVVIGPAVENPPTEEALQRLAAWLEKGRAAAGTADSRKFRRRLEQLREHGYWPGLECLGGLMLWRPESLFDHVPAMRVVVDEPERVDEALLGAHRDLREAHAASGNRVLPPPDELYVDAQEIRAALAKAHLRFHALDAGDGALRIASRPTASYAGRLGELAGDLTRAGKNGNRNVFVMRARGGADRLREILGEYDLHASDAIEAAADGADLHRPGGIFLGLGSLRGGFEYPDLGIAVYAERDLFGKERKAAEPRGGSRAAFIADFRDLKPGDAVVHVDHGIARYVGLGRPKGGSLNRDFMILQYAGNDRLFVPVDRLELVQRHTGAGARPTLDKLGGPGWERVKAKVRKSVRAMAKELLDLYARRSAARGHAFAADTPWQQELEGAFPFDLTPDQQRAVAEVKQDMESARPMDRLLVGDVGFGKTEVAVRAAFKATMDGYQAAVLAPTTVLAMQHWQTFSERFAPFPLRVEMVSRFRSASESKKIMQDVSQGMVDVLIGTHRLLSKDSRFKRLGLLIVDEEQRFGVAHKERLKKMTVGVDVLAMTATPIPRTLQMSMGGVRDLSVIETPPPGRMSIQTYVVPFRKNALAQAIRQELRREGQVFVVHDRVETLPAIGRAVREMAPEARVVFAHGQMSERALEKVMLSFIRHEADVLVTTTIIENGLDIPRANTIIVNRADRMGLSQLYQLRGRVGRSHVPAYAYFVIPGRENLSQGARQRLKALQEFSELGSGFRLAAADLEIRGAGELLGSRQHGHIAALGFDMYCQMLERAVSELKGDPVDEREPPSLHLGIDIKIPESYLPESGDRLGLYKRLAQTSSEEEVERLNADTEDRYGHLPPAAQNLFAMARLRLLAAEVGVQSINLADDKLQIRFYDKPPIEPQRVVEMVAREKGSLTPSGMVLLPAPPRGTGRIQAVRALLRQMAGRSAA